MSALLVLAAALHLGAPPELAELGRTWAGAFGAAFDPSAAEVTLTGTLPGDDAGTCTPIAVGAVAVVYNALLAGDLRLDENLLAAILDGRIRRLRDPLLQAANPGVALPDLPLRVVLPLADPEPLRSYAAGAKSFAGVRTADVGAAVRAEEGSIGFLSAAVARREGFELAALRNRDGAFVLPAAHSVSRAAVGVKLPADLRASLSGARGADSYPMSWLVYACARDPALAAPFLRWALRDGQKLLAPLGYAPLPGFMVLLARQRLQ